MDYPSLLNAAQRTLFPFVRSLPADIKKRDFLFNNPRKRTAEAATTLSVKWSMPMNGSNLPNIKVGDMVRLKEIPAGIFDYLPDSEAQSLYNSCRMPVRVERLDNTNTVTVLLSSVWNEECDAWEGHELTIYREDVELVQSI